MESDGARRLRRVMCRAGQARNAPTGLVNLAHLPPKTLGRLNRLVIGVISRLDARPPMDAGRGYEFPPRTIK
jgi:hypothetical protein